MSDLKLRDLERRFKETGAVEDEAAWLLERVRLGLIDRALLEVAAYCSHPGATAACGPGAPVPPDLESAALKQRQRDDAKGEELKVIYGPGRPEVWGEAKGPVDRDEFRAWMETLGSWGGAEARVRAAWGLVLEACDGLRDNPDLEGPLYSVADWILDPCESKATRALAAASGAEKLAADAYDGRIYVEDDGSGMIFPVNQVPMMVCCLAEAPTKPGYADDVAAEVAADVLWSNCAAWAIVQQCLIPWALGHSDPVRERVAVREQEAAGE